MPTQHSAMGTQPTPGDTLDMTLPVNTKTMYNICTRFSRNLNKLKTDTLKMA
jgi:hypothetical protein